MKNKRMISIIIPFYNEVEVFPFLFKSLEQLSIDLKYDLEFLFVNDGSTDESLELVRQYSKKNTSVSFIDLSRNFGKEIAMAAGFKYAKGDAAVVIDADLQDPPSLIIKMAELWEQGYDDVFAVRKSRKGESFLKRFTSYSFYRVLEKVSRVPIQKDTGDFRLLSRKAINALNSLEETQRYTKGMFSLIGFKKIAIEYEREPRVAGKTKWNYFKLMNLAIEGITSFTTFPLRIANIMGTIFAFTSFLYMIWIIIKTLIFGEDVQGYPSLVSIILFIGGIQLISLGIIGEYLGRIFNETKKRPLFFINEYKGLDDSDE